METWKKTSDYEVCIDLFGAIPSSSCAGFALQLQIMLRFTEEMLHMLSTKFLHRQFIEIRKTSRRM